MCAPSVCDCVLCVYIYTCVCVCDCVVWFFLLAPTRSAHADPILLYDSGERAKRNRNQVNEWAKHAHWKWKWKNSNNNNYNDYNLDGNQRAKRSENLSACRNWNFHFHGTFLVCVCVEKWLEEAADRCVFCVLGASAGTQQVCCLSLLFCCLCFCCTSTRLCSQLINLLTILKIVQTQ